MPKMVSRLLAILMITRFTGAAEFPTSPEIHHHLANIFDARFTQEAMGPEAMPYLGPRGLRRSFSWPKLLRSDYAVQGFDNLPVRTFARATTSILYTVPARAPRKKVSHQTDLDVKSTHRASLSRLQTVVKLYRWLRAQEDLASLMSPASGTIGIVRASVLAYQLNSARHKGVALNVDLLRENRSPYSGVLALRHEYDHRAYPHLSQAEIIVRDALFLKKLSTLSRPLSPADVTSVRSTYERMISLANMVTKKWSGGISDLLEKRKLEPTSEPLFSRQENDRVTHDFMSLSIPEEQKHPYIKVLSRLAALKDPAQQLSEASQFVAERLYEGLEEPVWGRTLTLEVFDHLSRLVETQGLQPKRLSELCAQAALARVFGSNPLRRGHAVTFYLDFLMDPAAALDARKAPPKLLKRLTEAAMDIRVQLIVISPLPPEFEQWVERLLKAADQRERDWAIDLLERSKLTAIISNLPIALAIVPVKNMVNRFQTVLRARPEGWRGMAEGLVEAAYRNRRFLQKARRIAEAMAAFGDSQKTFLSLFNESITQRDLRDRGFALVEAARERQYLSPSEVQAMYETVEQVWRIHYDQPRYDGRPYFVHPLDVVWRLIFQFKITDPVVFRIAMAHDTREDKFARYKLYKRDTQTWVATTLEREQFNLFRLGVRMLSDIPTTISQAWADRLKARGILETNGTELTPAQAQYLYYLGLRDPEMVYGKADGGKRPARYAKVTPEFLHDMQLTKCIDRISNWKDYPWFFENQRDITEKMASKPARDFNKTFNYFIPFLLNAPNALSKEDVELVYSELAGTLLTYARLPDNLTRALPLRDAARSALVRMEKALEDALLNPRLRNSSRLQQLAFECSTARFSSMSEETMPSDFPRLVLPSLNPKVRATLRNRPWIRRFA